MSEDESRARKREELSRIYINEILRKTFEGIGQLSEEAAETVLQSSCRGCAQNTLAFVAHNYGYDPEKPDIDAYIVAAEKMEKRFAEGQASITKEGNTVTHLIKPGACICPLVKDFKIVPAFPNLCLCSKNYLEFLYGAAAQRPAKAELIETYNRGGNCCHFRIELL